MTTVLIADDHPLIRRGLRDILAENENLQVCGEASNAAEVLQILAGQPCDVLLLDITMPGRSGLEVLIDVRQQYPQTAVLILSTHPEDQFALRAIRAGASGYLTKDSAPDELVSAIEAVAAGRHYLTPTIAQKLAAEVGGVGEGEPHESLSNREFEVLRHIARLKSVTQIADEMSLSVKTVSTYRTRLLEKLGLESNADLIKYARDHGIEN